MAFCLINTSSSKYAECQPNFKKFITKSKDLILLFKELFLFLHYKVVKTKPLREDICLQLIENESIIIISLNKQKF